MKRRLQYVLDAIFGIQPPSQVALGATLGMFVGMVPKDTLIAFLACLLILASAANLYCSILSALTFSIIGWFIEPLLHKLGAVVLSNDMFGRLWSALYQLPVVPWTRVNNTVVMGSVVASLIFAYPLFATIRAIAAEFSPQLKSVAGHLVNSRFRTDSAQQSPVSSR